MSHAQVLRSSKRGNAVRKAIWKYRYYYLMLLPGIAYAIIFHYIPMTGLVIAFQDYKVFLGIDGSKFIGLANFERLFNTSKFLNVLSNTFIISGLKILFGFPVPIFLAILINEVRQRPFQRIVQTVVYLPHFISWVIMSGIIMNLLAPGDGLLNLFRIAAGEKPIFFMAESSYFRAILVITDIWKEMGWSAIIYLAALAGVPQEIHEAALIDGSNRIQRIVYISLPYILPTITVMFLLRLGGVLSAGFDQVFSLYNSAVYSVGDIIDTYVYRIGIIDRKYGFSTAVGLFKSVVACVFVLTFNYLANRAGQESLL
ncbi:MAG: ABC transporter permease [Christensenellales bacterium]